MIAGPGTIATTILYVDLAGSRILDTYTNQFVETALEVTDVK